MMIERDGERRSRFVGRATVFRLSPATRRVNRRTTRVSDQRAVRRGAARDTALHRFGKDVFESTDHGGVRPGRVQNRTGRARVHIPGRRRTRGKGSVGGFRFSPYAPQTGEAPGPSSVWVRTSGFVLGRVGFGPRDPREPRPVVC